MVKMETFGMYLQSSVYAITIKYRQLNTLKINLITNSFFKLTNSTDAWMQSIM